MRRVAVAVGTDPTAREAAQAYLVAGGDAVGAVVSGFFAAAGASPGVLFGPLGLLIAQVGVGVRAFDGRQRQPGIGLRRGRGFGPDESIPTAARVAAPTGIAALFVALRYGRSVALPKVVSSGVMLAKKAGCPLRAEVLDQVQRLGAAALAAPGIARALIHVAGPSEGGSLGMSDLESIPELDHPARALGGQRVVPWLDERLATGQAEADWWQAQAERQQGLCARDVSGGVAALCYDQVHTGLLVEELELILPLNAVPARRGVTRIVPGRFLPSPVPLSIDIADGDIPSAASVGLLSPAPISVRASG